MGSCVCGDTNIDLQFPGPDGIVYAIQTYGGCEHCGTPAGVIVYRFDTTRADVSDFWYRHAPEPNWRIYPGQSVHGDFAIPVLDFDAVADLAKQERGKVRDWIEDELVERMREVVGATLSKCRHWIGRAADGVTK